MITLSIPSAPHQRLWANGRSALTVRILTASPSRAASSLKRRVCREQTPVSIDGITLMTSGLPANCSLLIAPALPWESLKGGALSPGFSSDPISVRGPQKSNALGRSCVTIFSSDTMLSPGDGREARGDSYWSFPLASCPLPLAYRSLADTVASSSPGSSSTETGQVCLVFSAASANAAWSIPGTLPSASRWILVILKPFGPLLSVSVAWVRISPGTWPAWLRLLASAMLKQAACAAASSSSGLLPVPSSKREVNVILASRSAPLSVEAAPLPLRRSPAHIALACRRISDIVASFRRSTPTSLPVDGCPVLSNDSPAGLTRSHAEHGFF